MAQVPYGSQYQAPFQGPVLPGIDPTLFRVTGKNYSFGGNSLAVPGRVAGTQSFAFNANPANAFGVPKVGNLGGGGGSRTGANIKIADKPNIVGPNTNVQKTTAPKAAYIPNYTNDVLKQYEDSENFLNNYYNEALGQQGDFVNAAGSQFDAQRPLLDQARNEALTSNQASQDEQRQREASALSEAKALYNELAQGNRQRFGGTTSAGEFASEIQGREFARGQDSIRNTASQAINQLLTQKQDINDRYTAQITSLEQQKQAAINQAKQLYQQRLDSIRGSQFELGQSKNAALLDATREYNFNVQQAQDKADSYRQQIDAAVQQANIQLRNSLLSYQAQNNQPLNLPEIPGVDFSTIGGSQQSYSAPQTPSGYFRRPEEDNIYN